MNLNGLIRRALRASRRRGRGVQQDGAGRSQPSGSNRQQRQALRMALRVLRRFLRF